MWELLIFIVGSFIVPVLIEYSKERGHFRWVGHWLRELWMGVFMFLVVYMLWGTTIGMEVGMRLRGVAGNSLVGYIVSSVVGAAIFCGYWWFLGTVEKVAANESGYEQRSNIPHNPPQQETNSGNTITGNDNIVGNNNVVNRSDPRVLKRLDEIKAILHAQQGDNVEPQKLLRKYPLGYVIFDADYQNTVFPYQNTALEAWDFDWRQARVFSEDKEHIGVILPSIRRRGSSHFTLSNISIGGMEKKVGIAMRGIPLVALDDQALIVGEILAVKPDGVVFLLGFVPPKPKAR